MKIKLKKITQKNRTKHDKSRREKKEEVVSNKQVIEQINKGKS